MIAKKGERIDSLDFLRGIAIFGVVAFHTSIIFRTDYLLVRPASMGFLGVPLFFIVSALTMCSMWEKRRGETSPATKFYIRRFCRIAGPFWVALAFYWWLSPHWPSDDAPEGVGLSQIISAALFVHTLSPAWIDAIVPGGWSIGVEMLFYAVFPLLMRLNGSPRLYLAVGFAIYILNLLIIQPLGSHLLASYPNQVSVLAFLNRQFFNQGPTFLIGMALYQYIRTDRMKWNYLTFAVLWISLSAIGKWLALTGAAPGLWLPVFAIALFAYFVTMRSISWRPLNVLGEMSYSIYLSHFVVLFGLSAIYDRIGLDHHRLWSFYLALAITTAVTFVLGLFFRRLIEEPSSNVGRWIIQRMTATTQGWPIPVD